MAFFVPHAGCPHQCSFCDQKSITGEQSGPTAESVQKTLQKVLADLGDKAPKTEVAFFGGSFTAVPAAYRLELLKAAFPFVGGGGFYGVRISTRPDAVDATILDELKEYGVTAVELGAQSMDDRVLSLNERGHTAGDVEKAVALIKAYGFTLGLQMMTGLYGSSDTLDLETAERIAGLRPDCVRIYPTVVMRGTRLAALYHQGLYAPPSAEEAVPLCARLLSFFEERGIPVIRLGLHDSPELKEGMLSGAYHPAFREKCESYLFYDRMLRQLTAKGAAKGPVTVFCSPSDLSKVIGQKRENIQKLNRLGYAATVAAHPECSPGEIRINCR